MVTQSGEMLANDMISGGASKPIIEAEDLRVSADEVDLINGIYFSIYSGERVGLIGESGSGKSLTALALMGLLPEMLKSRGSVRLVGQDENLLNARDDVWRPIRGNRISMVFQEPMSALNPMMRIGRQIEEAVSLHNSGLDKGDLQDRVLSLLKQVQLPDPDTIARKYSHQLSGGQRQRIVLAMALANEPELLICDEPTTALDVTVQDEMLHLIRKTLDRAQAALLFITHDLAVVANTCERILVMYGGKIVEAGPIRKILRSPRHPYTAGLIGASDLEERDSRGRLKTIEGMVPEPGHFPAGCVFRNRCEAATSKCEEVPRWDGDRSDGFACWNPLQ